MKGYFMLLMLLVSTGFFMPISQAQSSRLELEKDVAQQLQRGQEHTYEISAEANQFVRIILEEEGIMVRWKLFSPDGTTQYSTEFRGFDKAKVINFATAEKGVYRLHVRPFFADPEPGNYRLNLAKQEALAKTPQTKLDQLYSYWDTSNNPGFAIAVLQHGKCVYKKGFGMANLEYDVPITSTTVFDIMSVSKQFAGMAIAILANDGKLSLDDDVRKYLPEVPDFGTPITIRHLMHHTSGIRDFPSLLNLANVGYRTSLDLILKMVQNQRQLNFKPGDEMTYSNTGYNLLALVVERITGQGFREWTQKHMFAPLGMNHTFFHDDSDEVIKNRAYAYQQGEKSLFKNPPNDLFMAMGSSSLFTTIDDAIKWVGNFEHGRVGGRKVLEMMHQTSTLNSGEPNRYAFGNEIGVHRGLPTVEHSGSGFAFSSDILRFPEQKFSVIIFSNFEPFYAGEAAFKVADIFLENQFPKEESEETNQEANAQVAEEKTGEINLSTEQLERYVGKYFFPVENRNITVALQDDKTLTAQPDGGPLIALQAISETKFFVHPIEANLSFILNEQGEVESALMERGEMQVQMPKVEEEEASAVFHPEEVNLDQFAGRFYSPELNVNYTLQVEDEQLVAKDFWRDPIQLHPEDHDSFKASEWYLGRLIFTRNEEGAILGFSVTTGERSRNIQFEKVD